MRKTPTHILVIRLSAMGDVAMSVPVLRALTQQHTELQITVLSRGFFEPMFASIPNVTFYTADVKGRHKGLRGLYRLFRELKPLRFDAIADIHNVLRSKVLRAFFTLSGIKTATIDKGRAEKKALTRSKNKVFKPLKTTHERYAEVFRKLGLTLDLNAVQLPNRPDLLPRVQQLVLQNHLPWIGIAPFAQHAPKMYPLDLMEAVISALASENKYSIFLFGGGKIEVAALSKLAADYSNTICVAGALSFEEELSLIGNLDLMVSMDSANGHLAAMQQVKTITLWGATHPYAGFAPFDQDSKDQLFPDKEHYPHLPCSIFGNTTCNGYEDAMRSIPVAAVVSSIKAAL